jgi:hypothetical protein
MHADSTFQVTSSAPVALPDGRVAAGLDTGVLVFEKTYVGAIAGRSSTIFTSAYDAESGVGTYVALETFEGSVDARTGSFAFWHAASTSGAERANEHFGIIPSSGIGELTGITGDGGLAIDPDGTHRCWLDYEIG